MASAAGFLSRSQNPDGGWGYRVQGMSYVEPTAAAILVLEDSTAQRRALGFLLSIQHADGGWGIAALDPESGWMTAWAVLALARFSGLNDVVARGAQWLIDTEGIRATDEPSRAVVRRRLQIDSTLRGWPWQRGDAAWVHPTALAMLALTAAGRGDHARVGDAVGYLYDRAVTSGGWNIGNPVMLDKIVPATIQDTTVALLALEAAKVSAGDAQITKAVQFLRDALIRAKTPAELAWGIYALRDMSADSQDAEMRLNQLQSADGSWLGNPFITAVAMLAQARRKT